MPRQPLFCQTCTDLVAQLSKATDDAIEASAQLAAAVGTQQFQTALAASRARRNQYQEIREWLQQHRDAHHRRGPLRAGGNHP